MASFYQLERVCDPEFPRAFTGTAGYVGSIFEAEICYKSQNQRILMAPSGHLQELRLKRRRHMRFVALLPVWLFLLAGATYLAVDDAGVIGVSDRSIQYLLHTVFYRFSYQGFLITWAGDPRAFWLTPLYTIVYWVYHAAVLGLIVLPALLVARRSALPGYERGWLEVDDLIRAIERYIRDANGFNSRNRLRYALARTRIVQRVSPILPQWYWFPEHQWFRPSAISNEEKQVVTSLGQLRLAIRAAMRDPSLLRQFLAPLQYLVIFFETVNKRVKSDAVNDSPRLDPDTERGLLIEFARQLRPLVIRAKAGVVLKQRSSRFRWVRAVISSPLVRQAAMLSVVSAFVMVVGVFLFRVSASQAFLTWFTVAFGSVTISVGVTTISLARRPQRNVPGRDDRNDSALE